MKLIEVILDPKEYGFLHKMGVDAPQTIVTVFVSSCTIKGWKEVFCPWFPYPHPDTGFLPDMTCIRVVSASMVEIQMKWHRNDEEIGFQIHRKFVKEIN